MDENKRVRTRVEFPVQVEVKTAAGTTSFAECGDISMNGIFLYTLDPLPVGDVGEICISVGSGLERKEVRALFEVVRVVAPGSDLKESGMGLLFAGIDPDSSITLFNIIRYQSV